MKTARASVVVLAGLAASCLGGDAIAQVTPGISFDFEDGTAQNWEGGANPTNIASGGPNGADDSFLQIGGGRRLAVYNLLDLSGTLDPEATSISVDLNRPVGEPDLDLRIVLFGPGTTNRWTSTAAVVVPGNGQWDTYEFSLLEN
ncbi:MAG: hypothetical protein AAF266_04205, partial [Planctomycetota bacterium]